MTLYYQIKQNKHRGTCLYVYDSSKPFKDAVKVLNKAKQHDADKKYLLEVMRYDDFVGPGHAALKVEDNPLLWFNFSLPRMFRMRLDMKSDKTLKELQAMADKFDEDFKKGGR